MTNTEKALQKTLGYGAEDFTKKALKGGYEHDDATYRLVKFEEIILDPLAWKAVGEIEGWERDNIDLENETPMGKICAEGVFARDYCVIEAKEWVYYMHQFIDNLIELTNE